MVQDITHLPPIASSDHECLLWMYICHDDHYSETPTLKKFNYAKGDYVSMNQFLSQVDWKNLFTNHHIEDNWLTFKNLLTTAINQFVPTILCGPKTSKVPWWTKSLTKEVVKKHLCTSEELSEIKN